MPHSSPLHFNHFKQIFQKGYQEGKSITGCEHPFPEISEEQTIETSIKIELKPQLYV